MGTPGTVSSFMREGLAALSDRMSSHAETPSARGEVGQGRNDMVLRAALDLAAEHDPDELLDRLVHCAADVAGARYAALGVYDASGRIERFVYHGVDDETAHRIGHPSPGPGPAG